MSETLRLVLESKKYVELIQYRTGGGGKFTGQGVLDGWAVEAGTSCFHIGVNDIEPM
jgi:hypothetical protein